VRPTATTPRASGSQSQDWFNGDNWTPAAPPAPDDDAVIDTNQPNGPAVNWQALFVGLGGAGSLNVINGGQVFSGSGSVGQLQGPDGSALISGPGSTWTNAGALIVGDGGAGTLFVINGVREHAGWLTLAAEF